MVVVTLGQQYNNVREKTTVILYTYINRHAGTPDKNKNKQKHCVKYITQPKSTKNNVVHNY